MFKYAGEATHGLQSLRIVMRTCQLNERIGAAGREGSVPDIAPSLYNLPLHKVHFCSCVVYSISLSRSFSSFILFNLSSPS